MKLGAIEDVYVQQLSALRSSEEQLRDALPKLEDVAHDQKLVRALAEHQGLIERQLERLEQLVGSAPADVPSEECRPIRAMLEDIGEIVAAEGPAEVHDVALVAALQRAVHFEIASYGTARALADQLALRDAVDLLGETIEEEGAFDELLTKIATGGLIVSGLNERAQDVSS
jgi:ferritin-like metal-binding protein YciE